MAIVRDGVVHMAHMAIHYGFSINGVAALHTKILEDTELHPFYELYPEKFSNKTNGITFRRWIMDANPALSGVLDDVLGTGWRTSCDLSGLLAFKDDEAVLARLDDAKSEAKAGMREFLWETQGVRIPEDAIIDVQVKRIHEYKRQQMLALYIIWKYLDIKKHSRTPAHHRLWWQGGARLHHRAGHHPPYPAALPLDCGRSGCLAAPAGGHD